MNEITILQGSTGAVFIGLGIGQVLHGHSWGYLLIAAGLVASASYLAQTARSLLTLARQRRHSATESEGEDHA